MNNGEKELRQAFEEVTTRNVITSVAYSNETRKLIRELELKVSKLAERIRIQDETIQLLKQQLAVLQTKIFSGGTS